MKQIVVENRVQTLAGLILTSRVLPWIAICFQTRLCKTAAQSCSYGVFSPLQREVIEIGIVSVIYLVEFLERSIDPYYNARVAFFR